MFENPTRGRQARNLTTNVPKIVDLKSSSEQVFSEHWRWVPLKFKQRLSSVLNWLTVMGVFSAWQKRGPGLLPRRLQYRSMNFTGQKGEDSSPCQKGDCLYYVWNGWLWSQWSGFSHRIARNRMLSYGITVVWHALLAASLTDAKETIEGCEKHGWKKYTLCCRRVGVLERAYEVMQDRFRYR